MAQEPTNCLRSLYSPLFAHFYDSFMLGIEKRTLSQKRRKIIPDLKGNILEIGSGTGINFPFYDESACVTALEPSEYMWKKAKAKMQSESIKAKIIELKSGIQDPSLEQKIQPHSIDVIVCTLVLCSIPEVANTLHLFQKWLKPGGKLILLEHIHSQDLFYSNLQNILNPVWNFVADGCNLNRNTDKIVKSFGFTPIKEEYFIDILLFYQAECIYNLP